MTKLISRIACQDDAENKYTVEVWQEYKQQRNLSGPSENHPGLRRLALSSGGPVNYIDENTFQIVQTDTIIRRI